MQTAVAPAAAVEAVGELVIVVAEAAVAPAVVAAKRHHKRHCVSSAAGCSPESGAAVGAGSGQANAWVDLVDYEETASRSPWAGAAVDNHSFVGAAHNSVYEESLAVRTRVGNPAAGSYNARAWADREAGRACSHLDDARSVVLEDLRTCDRTEVARAGHT